MKIIFVCPCIIFLLCCAYVLLKFLLFGEKLVCRFAMYLEGQFFILSVLINSQRKAKFTSTLFPTEMTQKFCVKYTYNYKKGYGFIETVCKAKESHLAL